VRCRPEQQEVGVRGPDLDRQLGERTEEPAALFSDDRNPRLHLVDEREGQAASLLGHRREVVRQGDLHAGGHHLGVCHQVAEAGGGHRPGLGERTHDHQPAEALGLLAQLQGRMGGELPVGLVDHDQALGCGQQLRDQLERFCPAGRIVRGAHESEDRLGPLDELDGLRAIDGEVRTPPARDHRGPGDPGDVAVEGVRRLEGRRRPAGTAVGEQQALEHLVRPVGAEDLLCTNVVQCCHARAQPRRLAVGVAVEGGGSHRVGELLAPRLGRRER